MRFQHDGAIWADFPELVPVVATVSGVTTDADVDAIVERLTAQARERLAGRTEAELPEIQAWRRAFGRMGLKPTQVRCASEALLRRFRTAGDLPRVHPLVDLCNALSLATAVPIAVFDLAHVDGDLTVRRADGSERYRTFGGDVEHPDAGEVVFADAAGQAHARRWTNRQSGLSAVGPGTSEVLIVSEALHPTARADQERLLERLRDLVGAVFGPLGRAAVLSADAPRFDTAG